MPLFDYRLFPVCAPALAARLGSAPTAAKLLEQPLIAIYSESRHWDIWFESLQSEYTARPAIVVDTLAVALEIALDGRGIALVNGPFATDDLQSGRLVRPVNHEVKCPGSWGVICLKDAHDNVRIKAFMDWIATLVR